MKSKKVKALQKEYDCTKRKTKWKVKEDMIELGPKQLPVNLKDQIILKTQIDHMKRTIGA